MRRFEREGATLDCSPAWSCRAPTPASGCFRVFQGIVRTCGCASPQPRRSNNTHGVPKMRRLMSALLLATAVPLHAATYVIEPHHTQGVVRWSHLGFAYPTAQFARVEGVLVFDPATPAKASVNVRIPIAAMTSGVPDLDEDLRSERFFDLARFPEATFVFHARSRSRRLSTRSAGIRATTFPRSASRQPRASSARTSASVRSCRRSATRSKSMSPRRPMKRSHSRRISGIRPRRRRTKLSAGNTRLPRQRRKPSRPRGRRRIDGAGPQRKKPAPLRVPADEQPFHLIRRANSGTAV